MHISMFVLSAKDLVFHQSKELVNHLLILTHIQTLVVYLLLSLVYSADYNTARLVVLMLALLQ